MPDDTPCGHALRPWFSTLDWLDPERTGYQVQDRISRDAQLLKNLASLHRALGLGWAL